MSAPLALRVRTPAGALFEGPVGAIVAEDLDGWFGIRPGRADLVAALPPGLLVFRDAAGERFAAHSGGMLALERGECRVALRDAVLADRLADVAPRLAAERARRAERATARAGVLGELEGELLRRLAREAP